MSALRQNPSSQSLQSALQSLSELAQLPSNWDSYGAEPPSSQAITIAQQMLTVIYGRLAARPECSVQPTFIAPLADGGIQLEWNFASTEFAIQISPTGELGYLLVTHDKRGRHTEEAENVPWGQAIEMIATTVFSV